MPKGIASFIANFIRAKSAAGMRWTALYGSSALCGIGFTMSLLIGSLAFADANLVIDARMGILLGSLILGILGYFLLRRSCPSS